MATEKPTFLPELHGVLLSRSWGRLMIFMFAALQAFAAGAIAPPVSLQSQAVLARPTAAAKALSVEGLAQVPSVPVTVILQCLTDSAGRLLECIPGDDGGTVDLAIYRQRLFSVPDKAKAEPVFAAALARMPYYRIKPVRSPGKTAATVLVREVISAADKAPLDVPIGTIAKGGVVIDLDPLLTPASFYPTPALRAGAQTRVSATCRVLDDLSLFCHDPKVDLPPISGELPMWRVPEFDASFNQATLQVLASARAKAQTLTGEGSIGREVPISMNWKL